MAVKLGRISTEKADVQSRLKRLEESAQELGIENRSLSQKLATCEMELEMTKIGNDDEMWVQDKNRKEAKLVLCLTGAVSDSFKRRLDA